MTEKEKQELIECRICEGEGYFHIGYKSPGYPGDAIPISEMYKIFDTSKNCVACDGKGRIRKGIFFSYRDPVHRIMYEDPANKDLL